MSNYKPIDDRQVINRAALSNIGSPADDSLDDILSKINAILGGVSGGSDYIAKEAALTSGSTSISILFPEQPDLSYVVFVMMENLIDPTPQFQQVEITSKSTTGFTVSWNVPLDSANYVLSYIVPSKALLSLETSISASSTSLTESVPAYLSQLENFTDANPQFQSSTITTNSPDGIIKWNVPTDTANYLGVVMANTLLKQNLGNGISSATVTLPVGFGSIGYAMMATLVDLTDPTPQFVPLLVTAKTNNNFTVSLPNPTDTANYALAYYAISLTA